MMWEKEVMDFVVPVEKLSCKHFEKLLNMAQPYALQQKLWSRLQIRNIHFRVVIAIHSFFVLHKTRKKKVLDSILNLLKEKLWEWMHLWSTSNRTAAAEWWAIVCIAMRLAWQKKLKLDKHTKNHTKIQKNTRAVSQMQAASRTSKFSFHAFSFVFHFIDDERVLFSSPGWRTLGHGQRAVLGQIGKGGQTNNLADIGRTLARYLRFVLSHKFLE